MEIFAHFFTFSVRLGIPFKLLAPSRPPPPLPLPPPSPQLLVQMPMRFTLKVARCLRRDTGEAREAGGGARKGRGEGGVGAGGRGAVRGYELYFCLRWAALGVNNFDVSLIVHLLTSLASLPLGQDASQG